MLLVGTEGSIPSPSVMATLEYNPNDLILSFFAKAFAVAVRIPDVKKGGPTWREATGPALTKLLRSYEVKRKNFRNFHNIADGIDLDWDRRAHQVFNTGDDSALKGLDLWDWNLDRKEYECVRSALEGRNYELRQKALDELAAESQRLGLYD